MENKNKYGGTSFPEQIIFGFVKDIFSDAQNRAKVFSAEADIFIPSINCAIEIDGGYWHDDKIDKDDLKNEIFNHHGISVIRIREKKLGDLNAFKGAVIQAKLSVKSDLADAINLLMGLLAKITKNPSIKKELMSFKISAYDMDVKTPSCIASLFNKEVHPNVLDYAGGQLWDYDLNGNLNPKHVNFENMHDTPINFICPEENPRQRRLTRKNLQLRRWCVDKNDIDQDDLEEVLKFEFKKNNCTMMGVCEKKCKMTKKYVKFLIANYIPIYFGSYSCEFLAKMVFNNSKDLVQAINSPNCPDKFKQSMRYIYQRKIAKLSNNWVKNDSDVADYESAIKILSQEIEQDKVGNLFTKYVHSY